MDSFRKISLFLTVSTLAVAAPAYAQTNAADAHASGDAANTGADIVVTAQKRSESVQKVPVAITVVTSQVLARQNINMVVDLKRSVPSLEFAQPGQSPGSGGFIRGLGTTISTSTGEASVGLVIDQVPQGNVPQSNVFDVSRVEVLRGPQGTLYGQSVSAGLVNVVTNAPVIGKFSGYAQAELANDGTAGSEYSRRIVRAVVNVPVGKDAALRVAGHYDMIDDVTHNNLLNQGSKRDDRGVRARFLWQPSDDFTLNVIGDYNNVAAKNPPYFSFYKTADAGLTAVLKNCGITLGASNADNCTPVNQYNNQENYGLSVQADMKLGTHTLTWISAYRRDDARQVASIDGLPTASLASPYPNITYGPGRYDQHLFSQEIRLSSPTGTRFEYVVGGYYSNYSATRNYLNNLQLYFLPTSLTTAYTRRPQVQSLAAFGQATYRLTDALRLIAGGRYTSNEVQDRSLTISNAGGATGYFNPSSTVHNFSWKGGAQYDLSRRLMAYATVSRGFKGQTYDDDTNLGVSPAYVKPEIPTSIEVGLKGQVLDNKIGFDLNLFHTNVQNYQAQVCAADLTRGAICSAQNISKVVSKGVELGVFGQPIPGLSINGGVIYVHAVFPQGFIGTDGSDLGGYQLTNSARWKVTGSAEYEAQLTNSVAGFISADTVYRSRVRYVTSGGEDVTFKPHFITGARLGARFDNAKYEIAIFARNLFNIAEPTLRYNSPIGTNTTTQILTDGSFRVVGLSGNMKF
jgi:iron complex outermembrane receptor protein